jgi:SAM-dependent methyltransferase
MTTATDLDLEQAQAFGGRVLGLLNGAASILGVSAGHRTGLFDVMATMDSAEPAAIARSAGLNERYVREWLNGMSVAGIVDYDAATGRYRLPQEHAVSLTRAAGPNNLAAFAQVVPMIAGVEDELVGAFESGKGIAYSSFPAFARCMAEESSRRFDHNLIATQIPMAPGIVERLEAGIDVADLGCGSGHALNLMARQWPNSRFVGVDFAEQAIEEARNEARAWGLLNVRFEMEDATRLPGEKLYDFITTFDAVHDQADPAGLLATIARLLRPGGTYLCVDIAASSDVAGNMEHPMGPFLYTVSLFHCMSVSLAQGGTGLGTMWGEETATAMLKEAGFKDIRVDRVEGDVLNNYYIATR